MSDIIPKDGAMKPILVIPPGTMNAADIKRLRDNNLCVVVATVAAPSHHMALVSRWGNWVADRSRKEIADVIERHLTKARRK